MDLEEWEILPEDGYLEIQYDAGKKIFSRKYGGDNSKNLYKNNYFICPSQDSSELVESIEKSTSRVPKQLLHVPIQLSNFHDEEVVKAVINMEPINSSSSALVKVKDVPDDSGVLLEADHDLVSQVFFKKTIKNKSVDMKMDSPKSNNMGLISQIDPATIRFENEANPIKDEALESKNPLKIPENEKIKEISEEVTWGQNTWGMNIWKLSLNGFGAICSFGVVAASICIIILGDRKQNKQPHQQNQKRIKQVVHHGTRLNEAISTMRGVSVVRAHITVGGYYEGL